MDSILLPLFEKAMGKIGPLRAFIPAISESLRLAIAEEDVEKVRAICDEIQEAANALHGVSAHIRLSVDDGTVTLTEASTAFLKMEKFVDELEDCFRGYDEDDPVPPATEAMTEPGAD